MSPRVFAAIWTGAAALAMTAPVAVGQTVHELRDANTGAASTVTAYEDRLEIFSGGVIYLYQRDERRDQQQGAYYFNATLDQALLWPHQPGGQVWVRKPGELRFRRADMQIVAGGGVNPGGGVNNPGVQQQQPTIVIESALPGAGLATAVPGGRGNIEIGNVNANDVRNQFYVESRQGGFVRLIPAARPRFVIDIFNGNAAPGANVDMWRLDEAVAEAGEFRLIPAAGGLFQIESRLRRGMVWDVEGNVAVAGANIRLMPSHGGANQLFRVRQAGGAAPAVPPRPGGQPDPGVVLVPGVAIPGVGVPARPQPLQRVRVKLANTGANELWLVVIDRRAPNEQFPMRITAGNAPTVQLERDPLGQSIYDVSVYEVVRQSVVIDRTRGGAVSDENFSPRSVGRFTIPAAQRDGLIDVARKAKSARNPGEVARIDPEEFESLQPNAVPSELGDMPDDPSPAAPSIPTPPPAPGNGGVAVVDDPDGPFGQPGDPAAPATSPPGGRATAGLPQYFENAEQVANAPPQGLPLAYVRRSDAGLTAQFMRAIQEPYAEEIEQMYSETVVVDGVEKIEHRTRTITVAKIRTKLIVTEIPLTFQQCEAYRADGTSLDEAEAAAAVGEGAVAVFISGIGQRGDRQVDARALALCHADLPVVVTDPPEEESEPQSFDPGAAGPNFPATAVQFCLAKANANGELAVGVPQGEAIEETYSVLTPVVKEVVIDGKSVQKVEQIEVAKVRTVMNWKEPRWESPADETLKLYTMAGKRLSGAEAGRLLAKPQAVIYVPAGAKLDPWYRKVFRGDALVLAASKRK